MIVHLQIQSWVRFDAYTSDSTPYLHYVFVRLRFRGRTLDESCDCVSLFH